MKTAIPSTLAALIALIIGMGAWSSTLHSEEPYELVPPGVALEYDDDVVEILRAYTELMFMVGLAEGEEPGELTDGMKIIYYYIQAGVHASYHQEYGKADHYIEVAWAYLYSITEELDSLFPSDSVEPKKSEGV